MIGLFVAPRVEVFVSHSKDDPNLHFFHEAFSATAVKGGFMELESVKPPPWRTIAGHVRASRALFVSLSRPLLDWDYRHTGNWIDFEVGLACMQNKDVWVLEPDNEQIDFAVPYCTHYVRYNPDERDHVKWLKGRIELYARMFRQQLPKDRLVTCPKEGCGLSFYFLTDANEFRCPSCNTRLTWNPEGGQAQDQNRFW